MSNDLINERGQVGVGTLIVFIAMVVVAAIASGVLISAAGQLQTKSAQASEESSDQVSNRLQVVTALGTNISGNEVGAVNLTVRQSPSASEIDLQNVTVQWLGPSGAYALTHNSSSNGDGSFTVSTVKDADGSSPVLNNRDDRLRMNFDVNAITGSGLPAGSTLVLEITTDSGATTVIELTIPRSVDGEIAVRL